MAQQPYSEWILKLKLKAIAVFTIMVIALAGCQTLAATDDLPAWIIDPDSGSRAALQTAVNEALNTEVALADDALTNSSILIIQRNLTGSLESQPALGRNMDMPIQFRLVISGGDCVLVDQRNQSRRILENTRCKAR